MFLSVYLRVTTSSKYTHLLLYRITSSPLFVLYYTFKGVMMVQEQAQRATASTRVVVGVMSAKLTVRKVVKVDGAPMMAILLHLLQLLLRH